MAEDSGDKTEEPTPHKLREARNKGQIAKSKEVTSAILLFVSFYTLKFTATHIWKTLTDLIHSVLSHLSLKPVPEEFTIGLVGNLLQEGLLAIAAILAPMFAAVYIVGIAVESLQTGFLFSLEPLMPKFENLNPINGFKKFFSLKQYVELLKSIIKMGLVSWMLYSILKDQYFIVTQSQTRGIWEIAGLAGEMVITIITRIGILYIIIALLDYMYQRYEFTKSMRMSKKEIKEEYKRLEGDPMIKQRQKEAARQMSQGRQMGAVPKADVVVTNPVHIAIALEYKQKKMKAPRVIAKGKRLIAQEIKKIAEEYQIPIIENPPLAQSLFKTTEVGQEVPPEHYRVIAEILAFVFNLKKKRRLR